MEVPKKSIVTEIDGNGKIIKHLENKIGGVFTIFLREFVYAIKYYIGLFRLLPLAKCM